MSIVRTGFDGQYKLVEETGEDAVVGKSYKDFRGNDQVLAGGQAPHKAGAQGYVNTKTGAFYYASVLELEWVRL